MPSTYRNLAYAPRRPRPQGVFKFNKWPYGLNTSVPSFQILDKELAECLNFKVNKGGQQETREPITVYSNTVATGTGAVKTFAVCPIGATTYELLVDANYKFDYLDGSLDPQNIGTLEGDAVIIPFNGVAILLDGSYIKYCDDVTAPQKIAYDDGTGASGYQFNNLTGNEDSTIILGEVGANVRIATKFTSQAWTATYTIPPTTLTAKLTKVGTGGTGAIIARLRLVADDSILAFKTFLADVTDLTNVATEYSITFVAGDIAAEMSPSIAYYMSLEYAGGDGANHVLVHCSGVTSGGTCYKYVASPWAQVTTQNPIMGLRPGRPPKASFGAVKESRLYLAGDPDHPGYIWYSHVNTHLDWSTSDGGGYIGAIDNDANNFPIGAIIHHYGQLFILGKEDQPYLCKLIGSSPSNYSVPSLYQIAWARHRTAISVVNDIWYASADGIDALSGVEQYGDLRTFFASDPIFDRVKDYWATATAIAGYNPIDGQYWLYMPTYHRILIAHTKIPTQMPDRSIRYPWSEYELYRDIFTSASGYNWIKSQNGSNEWFLSTPQYEDWTAYTEVDPNGHITVAANSITAALGLGETAYLYYDLGGSIISGDFEFRVKAKFNSGEGIVVFAGVSDMVNDLFNLQANGGHEICVRGSANAGTYVIYLSESYGVYEGVDWTYASADTDYYLKVIRDESVGTHGTIYCYIYSDSDYSVLVDTLSLALSGNYDHRYIMTAQSYCIGGSETLNVTISDLTVYDRPYDPSIVRQPDFLTLDGKKITEDTAGSLEDHEWDYKDNDGLGYSTVYFRDESGDPDTTEIEIRSILAPQCFASFGNEFYIGASDGYVYKLNSSENKDLTIHAIRFSLKPKYSTMPFGYVNINRIQLIASSTGGARFNLNISKDGLESEYTHTLTSYLSLYDGLIIDEVLDLVDDALFSISVEETLLWHDINIVLRSFQISLDDIILSGYPLYIDGFIIKYRQLQY